MMDWHDELMLNYEGRIVPLFQINNDPQMNVKRFTKIKLIHK